MIPLAELTKETVTGWLLNNYRSDDDYGDLCRSWLSISDRLARLEAVVDGAARMPCRFYGHGLDGEKCQDNTQRKDRWCAPCQARALSALDQAVGVKRG